MNECRRESQQNNMEGLRSDLDIVHQNIEILEFGPYNNEDVMSGTGQVQITNINS